MRKPWKNGAEVKHNVREIMINVYHPPSNREWDANPVVEKKSPKD
jgi:hypothetical protein